MKILKKALTRAFDGIQSHVAIDDGVVTKQWTTVRGGNGGLRNEPQDLVGLRNDELPDGYRKQSDSPDDDCYHGY